MQRERSCEKTISFHSHLFILMAAPLVPDSATILAQQLILAVNTTVMAASGVYRMIPGSGILYKYIRASYQNDPQRSLLELLLVIWTVWYMFKKTSRKGAEKEIKLNETEIQELIDEWKPEPLVPELVFYIYQRLIYNV
jgi:hypothetical protein